MRRMVLAPSMAEAVGSKGGTALRNTRKSWLQMNLAVKWYLMRVGMIVMNKTIWAQFDRRPNFGPSCT